MSLTDRQLACLRHAADGTPLRETAKHLNVSESTAKDDMLDARRQLGARNTTHAVVIAIDRGLIGHDTMRQQVALVQLAERMGCWIALVPGRSA